VGCTLCFGGKKEALLIGTPRYVLMKLCWLRYSLLIIWQWSWFVLYVAQWCPEGLRNEECRYVPVTALAWNKDWQKLTGHRHLRTRLRLSTHNHTGWLSVTRLTVVWAVTHSFIGVIVSFYFGTTFFVFISYEMYVCVWQDFTPFIFALQMCC